MSEWLTARYRGIKLGESTRKLGHPSDLPLAECESQDTEVAIKQSCVEACLLDGGLDQRLAVRKRMVTTSS